MASNSNHRRSSVRSSSLQQINRSNRCQVARARRTDLTMTSRSRVRTGSERCGRTRRNARRQFGGIIMAFNKSAAKILSRDEERRLRNDILVRLDLQRVLSANKFEVVGAKYGISREMVHKILNDTDGKISHRLITKSDAAEIRRNSEKWRQAKSMIADYTIPALANQYGCSKVTISKRIRDIRNEINAMRRAA